MNTKLKHVQNWSEVAQQANWSVAKMAKSLRVSEDSIRRHMSALFGKTPRQWLAEDRQRQALVLLCDGSSVKETAARLGYKQQTNFTRKFKKDWGACPTIQSAERANLVKMHEND